MHIISIFRKSRKKNSFKLYLAFFEGFTSQIPFFYGRVAFCRIWLKAILLSSVQRLCSTLSPEFWLINQHISSRWLLSKNWRFFLWVSEPGVFGIRSAHPFMATSVLKTENPFPNFLWRKGPTSSAKASANHLAPSSSSTPSSRATQWPTFLLRPPSYGVQVVWPYSDCLIS